MKVSTRTTAPCAICDAMKRYAILGAGGHAAVVADLLTQLHGAGCIAAVFDDDAKLWGQPFAGLTVAGPLAALLDAPVDGAVIAIGDNRTRRRVYEWLTTTPVLPVSAIHPAAVIAGNVEIGCGVVAFANVVVNPGSRIGDNVILNTACTVDHHCVVGPHVHIAPGVHLAGGVEIGEGTLVGIGSVALPGVKIGRWATIGAGAAVVADIPDGATAVGVPARVIQPGT